jgi:sulfate transport system ATP-binding protein
MHIEIDEIAKDFGATAALQPVSLAIPSGRWWRSSGPRARARPRSCASWAGSRSRPGPRPLRRRDATGLRVQDRRAGFVFQHYALFRT